MSMTICFDLKPYRESDYSFDSWFVPLINELEIKYCLVNNETHLRGDQQSLIKMFTKIHEHFQIKPEDLINMKM